MAVFYSEQSQGSPFQKENFGSRWPFFFRRLSRSIRSGGLLPVALAAERKQSRGSPLGICHRVGSAHGCNLRYSEARTAGSSEILLSGDGNPALHYGVYFRRQWYQSAAGSRMGAYDSSRFDYPGSSAGDLSDGGNIGGSSAAFNDICSNYDVDVA